MERIMKSKIKDTIDVNKIKVGDMVEFCAENVCEAAIKWNGSDDPSKLLMDGSMYKIYSISLHSWSCTIQLEGVQGKFASVFFVLPVEVEK